MWASLLFPVHVNKDSLRCPSPSPRFFLILWWASHSPREPLKSISTTTATLIHISLSLFFLLAIFPASNIFCHFIHLSWIMRYIDVAINEGPPLPFYSYERNLIPQHSMAPSFDVFRNCFPTAKGFLFCFVQVSQAFLHLELFQNSNGSRGLQLRQLGLFINYCNAS